MTVSTGTSYTLAYGTSVPQGESPAPSSAPKGLIVARAVEVKDGWLGQICVAGAIIWESKPMGTATEAEVQATERIAKRITKVLA